MATNDSTIRKRLAVALQILKGSSISSWENVYVLGTHGRRINFTSQQTRAMNLGWALLERGILKSGSKACVVGAGLSGLSIAACLAERGVVVSLYDKNLYVLSDQHETHHRFVHPSLNFWPEGAVNATTKFPFFDWFAGPCSDVIKAIADEWELHFSDRVSCVLGNEVVGLENAGQRTKLRYRTRTGETFSEEYDVVILALGFGSEKRIDGNITQSYWAADNLERLRQTNDQNTTVVCGLGDGALIDLFRLAFNRSFERGKLTALFGNCIALNNDLSNRLANAEDSAKKGNDELSSIRLSEAYSKAIHELDARSKALLKQALQREMKDKLVLIGPLPAPYSTASAPVHKLMLAYLAQEGYFRYVQGKIVKQTDETIEIESSGVINRDRPGHVVVRIGSEHAVSKFFSESELSELINAQKVLSEINLVSQWEPKKFYLLNGKVVGRRSSFAFVADRAKRADKRVKEVHKEIENISAKLFEKGGPMLVAELSPNASVDQIDNFPNELFGIKVAIEQSRRMVLI